MTKTALDRKLEERLLLGRRVPGDRLMLADEVLRAALGGSRPLTANERKALQGSPLTLRRLRQLALERRSERPAANDAAWGGSAGMLRAADSGSPLTELCTDDRCWSLHFAGSRGAWHVILQVAANAPFAATLLRERPLLRVVDGQGGIVLQGRLDLDGECEAAWPFALDPVSHFQQAGAVFAVERAEV
ncbi:hypothetical protein [Massilia horti]|uniref:Uncharacterized protein n=1 Tax=Massilia horti TaxID=2562153 RepID=A0A4Y9T483_9BURK|nr:hypothetical protein [Massilia horti]TFW31868.1 hypothetical protein E4O92_12135 [Massilia horti]